MTSARIFVTLKDGILDPQGKAVQHAIDNLGIADVNEVRIGKLINLTFGEVSAAEALKLSREACEKLLANPVIEDYKIEVVAEDEKKHVG